MFFYQVFVHVMLCVLAFKEICQLARVTVAACMFPVCTLEKQAWEALCVLPEIFTPSPLLKLTVALFNVPVTDQFMHLKALLFVITLMKVNIFKQYVFVPGVIDESLMLGKQKPKTLRRISFIDEWEEKFTCIFITIQAS